MAKRNRYKEMEMVMTGILIADGLLFLLFLLFSGLGVIWAKVLSAIFIFLISGLCLAYLYLTGELFRFRSRWMTIGFGALVVCLLVSLICNYPSPNRLKHKNPQGNEPPAGSSTGNPTDGSTAYYAGGRCFRI